jgi:hypothetical protein
MSAGKWLSAVLWANTLVLGWLIVLNRVRRDGLVVLMLAVLFVCAVGFSLGGGGKGKGGVHL